MREREPYRSDDDKKGSISSIFRLWEHLAPDNQAAQTTAMAHLQDLVPLEKSADLFQSLGCHCRSHQITLQWRVHTQRLNNVQLWEVNKDGRTDEEEEKRTNDIISNDPPNLTIHGRSGDGSASLNADWLFILRPQITKSRIKRLHTLG